MRNGPFFCIQTFWRRFMVTNEAANSFPAEKKKKKDRKKRAQVVGNGIAFEFTYRIKQNMFFV